MALDLVKNQDMFNAIKDAELSWIAFLDKRELKKCMRRVIQLESLGSQSWEPLSFSEQVDELLSKLKRELDKERIIRKDENLKYHIYSVHLGLIIRTHAIPSPIEMPERVPHHKDAWRIVVECTIR